MRRFLLASLVASLLAAARGGAADAPAKSKPAPTCGDYGTAVEFVSTPSEAGRLAKQQQKLVFVLHVSGHFEDPQFT